MTKCPQFRLSAIGKLNCGLPQGHSGFHQDYTGTRWTLEHRCEAMITSGVQCELALGHTEPPYHINGGAAWYDADYKPVPVFNTPEEALEWFDSE